MNKILIIALLAIGLALGGCSNMSDTQKRTGGGAVIGAGAGTAIGAASGSAGWGAAIGTAAGATSGYLYDRYKKSSEDTSD